MWQNVVRLQCDQRNGAASDRAVARLDGVGRAEIRVLADEAAIRVIGHTFVADPMPEVERLSERARIRVAVDGGIARIWKADLPLLISVRFVEAHAAE